MSQSRTHRGIHSLTTYKLHNLSICPYLCVRSANCPFVRLHYILFIALAMSTPQHVYVMSSQALVAPNLGVHNIVQMPCVVSAAVLRHALCCQSLSCDSDDAARHRGQVVARLSAAGWPSKQVAERRTWENTISHKFWLCQLLVETEPPR